MNIAIRYDKGLGNATVYARLLGPSGFWNFVNSSWDVTESDNNRKFLTELADNSEVTSWYQGTVTPPTGGPYSVEYVNLSTGEIAGNDIAWGGTTTTVTPPVVIATPSPNFTTVDNVTMFLNKTSLTLSEAGIVNMLIEMVDGIVKNYCGWDVVATDYTATFSGDGTSSLYVPEAPVNSVSSLIVSLEDYTSNVQLNTKDGELYFLSEDGLVFTSGTDNISISYNAGYSEIPTDLVYAATHLVAINFNRIVQESIGVVEEKFNSISVTYDKTDMPPMIKYVLDKYRHIGIY